MTPTANFININNDLKIKIIKHKGIFELYFCYLDFGNSYYLSLENFNHFISYLEDIEHKDKFTNAGISSFENFSIGFDSPRSNPEIPLGCVNIFFTDINNYKVTFPIHLSEAIVLANYSNNILNYDLLT